MRAARLPAFVVSLFLLAACATAPQRSANVDPRNGDGIGGTGIKTADVGDGIGGTGIIGTISGFGSIIVNNRKLDFDRSTAVENDGRPANLDDLKVGQVIQGVARRRGDTLHLERLEIQHAVAGPITTIDYNAQTMTVLGQSVRVNVANDKSAAEAFRELSVGDVVDVSGLRQSDGIIIASRIDQLRDDAPVMVRGLATAVSPATIRVGGLDVSATADTVIGTPAVGGRVLVSGRMINGQFVADVITGGNALPFGADVADVSLEGYLPQGAPLAMQGITIDSATLPPDVAPNDRIVVNGRVSGPNQVTATSINRVRTLITILRASTNLRPAMVRPDLQRPERVAPPPRPERPQTERPQTERPDIERPDVERPTRPEIERPSSDMVG